VLDNLVYGHGWAVKWGALEVVDTSDIKVVKTIIDRYKLVAVSIKPF